MCWTEDKVLKTLERPHIYRRYIDDIYLEIENEDSLETLRKKLEEESVLKFTHEIGVTGKLPFLDVSVDVTEGIHATTVYRKKTDGGRCMNARSECPTRYKRGVIRTYVRRALKTCSTWQLFDREIAYVKKMLINNNYKAADIDHEIKTALEEYQRRLDSVKAPTPDENQPRNKHNVSDVNNHVLFYKNQMTDAHRQDERILKDIIKKNVIPTDNNKVTIRIYYKSKHTSNLIMKNNLNKSTTLKCSNIVYQFTCPHEDCKPHITPVCYVGHTTTTLSRRLTYHKQNGDLEKHMRERHNSRITRQELVEGTKILDFEKNRRRLRILEAVYIQLLRPALNIQRDHEGIITLHDMTV